MAIFTHVPSEKFACQSAVWLPAGLKPFVRRRFESSFPMSWQLGWMSRLLHVNSTNNMSTRRILTVCAHVRAKPLKGHRSVLHHRQGRLTCLDSSQFEAPSCGIAQTCCGKSVCGALLCATLKMHVPCSSREGRLRHTHLLRLHEYNLECLSWKVRTKSLHGECGRAPRLMRRTILLASAALRVI